MVHTSFVSTHLVNSLNFCWNNERHKFQSMRPKTTTFKTTLYIRCCASDTTQPKRTTSDQADKATKKLYRPIDYPINTEAYLSSENIRESLWKFTYERTQREEEADRNLQLLADEFQTMRKSVEEALLEQVSKFLIYSP